MQLLDSSSLPPAAPGMRSFRAGGYWERNLRGLSVVATAVAIFLVVLGCVLIKISGTLERMSVLLILTGIGVPLLMFPGKIAALYPYAVEIDEGRGMRFYSALGEIYLPIGEVKRVKWSWLYGAWVVTLKRRYGLLRAFLIHFTWGRQGRELAQAIEEEIARKL